MNNLPQRSIGRRKFCSWAVASATLANPILATADCTPQKCGQRVVIDPNEDIDTAWKRQDFTGQTRYERANVDGMPAIRATADNSASGLIRKLDFSAYDFPEVGWNWRVEKLQASADIREPDREDFAAAIFFLFGRPGIFFRGIRSLGYVWTTDSVAANSVVHGIKRPKQSRYLVLQSGEQNVGRWVCERRNLLDDYRRVFEEDAPEELSAVSVFVDNDQTGEAAESLFGRLCAMT